MRSVKEYEFLVKQIEQLSKENQEIKSLLKEDLRKTDRMANTMKTFSNISDGETQMLEEASKVMPYISVSPVGKQGINYCFLINSKDKVMSRKMLGGYAGVQSENELQTYLELAEKYYGIKAKESKCFVDIGANIGTTSIMVKKLYPKMKVVSFEPEANNLKVLRANSVLNDVKIEIVPKALGAANEIQTLSLNDDNMGNHRIQNESIKSNKTQQIEMDTFDSVIDDFTDSVDYVWMDVEGYEGHVLSGMRKTLTKYKFPIWMEFNPKMLIESGGLSILYNILPEFFYSFIDRHSLNEVRPISELSQVADSLGKTGDATDIFLIR